MELKEAGSSSSGGENTSGENTSSSDSYQYEVPGLSGHASRESEGLSGSQSSDPSPGNLSSDKSRGSSDPSGGSSASRSHTTSSSKHTTGSSVTWQENVSVQDGPSDARKDSFYDEDDHIGSSDSTNNRSSIRRFKEGSKMYAGFIEDADGLQPTDDMLPPMTWEEKCEIIEELCSALDKRLERLHNDKGGVLENLQTYADVAEHTIGTARKDRVELQRNVLQFAELLNPTAKPYAEDMIRYLTGRIIGKKDMKEKLEQRNRRLQKLVTNLKDQLDRKIDVKDVLHDSDIMELQNMNKDLASQLITRTRLGAFRAANQTSAGGASEQA